MMRHTPFQVGAAAVVGWEGAAYVTEALQEVGRLAWRVPYISELVRELSPSGRLLFYVGAGLVLVEHIERMYLSKRALGLLKVKGFSRVTEA